MQKRTIFIISSEESAERIGADVKDRDEGIASAIFEERSLTDAFCSRPIPDPMMKVANKRVNVLVDFGGPRSMEEIESFLTELLTDQDVVRTNLWPRLHRFLFRRVAKKRVKKISHDYASIGGKSPIYETTEALKRELQKEMDAPLLAFHRYLPATHDAFFRELNAYKDHEIHLLPLFPQFTYATTGSCARFFSKKISPGLLQKMRWVKSYPDDPHFIECWVDQINKVLKGEDAFLLFSFHGIPQKFVASGDLYLDECKASYEAVMRQFPALDSAYAFQSQFGRDIWLKPSTQDVSENIEKWTSKKKVLVIPLSFTSDHIETLFEIEDAYLPLMRKKGYEAERVPALNLEVKWVKTLKRLFETTDRTNTQMLIRKKGCESTCSTCKRRCTQ